VRRKRKKFIPILTESKNSLEEEITREQKTNT
jgi:hypothetical protein